MAKLTPMAPDSAGFKVLARLYDLGGTAFISQLIEVLWGGYRSPKQFAQVAAKPLTERGLVVLGKRDKMRITPEGRLLVDSYRRMVPAPRTAVREFKPLNVAKHFNWGETRPGALDYRQAPSLMGGAQVPFFGSDEEKAA